MASDSVPRVALVATAVSWKALVLYIIGMSTSHWAEGTSITFGFKTSVGLFAACARGICIDLPFTPDYLKTARAMIILGLLSAMVSVAIPTLVCVLGACGSQMKLPVQSIYVCAGSAIATVGFLITAIIILAVKFYTKEEGPNFEIKDKSLGYSLFLTIIGAGILLAAGIMFVLKGKPIFRTEGNGMRILTP